MLKVFRNKNVAKAVLWALLILILPAFVLWGTGSMGRSEKMPVSAGTQKNLWVIPPVDDRVEPLARSLKISLLVAQVLLNRGITEAVEGNIFLQPKLTELIRPAQMPGIEPAAARLREAIEKKQKITFSLPAKVLYPQSPLI